MHLCRYGRDSSFETYVKCLEHLCKRMAEVLPAHCLFLWLTALPISGEVHGGFLTKRVDYLRPLLPRMTREANVYASRVIEYYGYDVLDLHYAFWQRTFFRGQDGIHWDSTAHRFISAFILQHVAKIWGVALPSRRPALGIRRLTDPLPADLYARTLVAQIYNTDTSYVRPDYVQQQQQLQQQQATYGGSSFMWSSYEAQAAQHEINRDRYYGGRQAPYHRY